MSELTLWRKKQATLLYHYSSLDYLHGLSSRVDALISGADSMLEEAKAQGRDQFLVDKRWGTRNTSANWSTYGFPTLVELKQGVLRDIRLRGSEIYSKTGAYNAARMMDELSMDWSSPDEEAKFKQGISSIYTYALPIDNTMERQNGWSDSNFVTVWSEIEPSFTEIPKFQLRPDIRAKTRSKPPKTGVYVPIDDPYGALQFAWTGNDRGALGDCMTYSPEGLEAIAVLGYENLWTPTDRHLDFVMQPRYRERFLALNQFKDPNYEKDPNSALMLIDEIAAADEPREWMYVEMLPNQFEKLDGDVPPPAQRLGSPTVTDTTDLRGHPGSLCPRSGTWLVIHTPDSRREFKQGDVFPDLRSALGVTVWTFVGPK